MMESSLIRQWWFVIQGLNLARLENNASTLSNLHGCEKALGLQPLPELPFPDVPATDIFSRKPSFKELDIPGILFMRKCLYEKENIMELSVWAETLLRFLEINQATLRKKASAKFGSAQTGQMALLELTVLILDIYFVWDDLRSLNLALKLMDKPWIFSSHALSRNINEENRNLSQILKLVRLMILRDAALKEICIS